MTWIVYIPGLRGPSPRVSDRRGLATLVRRYPPPRPRGPTPHGDDPTPVSPAPVLPLPAGEAAQLEVA